jgi:ComF family protein
VKYKSAWDIIKFLYEISEFEKMSDFIVTSVPMWREKEKNRGFNQAKILAQIVSKEFMLSETDLLTRTRPTRPMFGLKKDERRKNIEGAFKIKKEQLGGIKNQAIILVDDLWTTGSTMRECAELLKRGGAKSVWGLTLAR